jgi:membrane protease YdiL (CAAX protease family)
MSRPADRIGERAPWQRHPLTQFLAVLLGVGPMYLLSILGGTGEAAARDFRPPTVFGSLLLVVIVVVLFGGVLVLLLNAVCGEPLRALNLRRSTLRQDLADGAGLCLYIIAAMLLYGLFLGWTGMEQVPAANRKIADALAANLQLLPIWFGPVVWLQAALYEEFSRVFLLSRLWQIWPGLAVRVAVVLVSATLFGLGHIYQGATGALGTAVIGMILGLHYMARGRVLPLIIAHGIYDTLVLATLVIGTVNGLF